MNAYQKLIILLTGAFLPLLLLFMKALAYGGIWIVGAAALGLSAMAMYAVRTAQTE